MNFRALFSYNFHRVAVLVVIAILVIGGLTGLKSANAQEQGGSGLSISPTRTELSLLPGSSDEVVVSLRNITSGPILAKIFVNDFEPDNETGEPRIVSDPERKNAASISGFLSLTDDVRLEEGESKNVSIPVEIPEDAAPGGYYGAIRFQALPVKDGQTELDGNQVSLTANLLSLVLIDVPGEIEQKVSVLSVNTFLDSNKGVLFTKKPNFVGVALDNQGNSFVKPFGRVTVKDFRGNEVFSYELNDANPRSNVLPESRRTFKDRLILIEKKTVNGAEVTEEESPITMPGRYTVTADVSYGNGGEVFTVSSSFWYVPVWLIVSLAVVILLIAGVVYYLYRKYKSKSTRRRR